MEKAAERIPCPYLPLKDFSYFFNVCLLWYVSNIVDETITCFY